jgi:hypothetical protein
MQIIIAKFNRSQTNPPNRIRIDRHQIRELDVVGVDILLVNQKFYNTRSSPHF